MDVSGPKTEFKFSFPPKVTIANNDVKSSTNSYTKSDLSPLQAYCMNSCHLPACFYLYLPISCSFPVDYFTKEVKNHSTNFEISTVCFVTNTCLPHFFDLGVIVNERKKLKEINRNNLNRVMIRWIGKWTNNWCLTSVVGCIVKCMRKQNVFLLGDLPWSGKNFDDMNTIHPIFSNFHHF